MSNHIKKLKGGRVLLSPTFAAEMYEAMKAMKLETEYHKQEISAMRDTCSSLIGLVTNMAERLDAAEHTIGRLMIGRS